MLEQTIIRHGAPTLAGMKTGSLFSINTGSMEAIEREARQISQTLEAKGVCLTIMKQGENRALLYLYREALMEKCLACPKAQEMLRAFGYDRLSVNGALYTLRQRLAIQESFPHEIGLFLGYPIADVSGFIRNRGKNCLLCGCWKVYSERDKATRTFARYRKCTDIYSRRFYTGSSIQQLTVAARSA